MSNFLQVLAQFVANILERAFGSKPSTLLTITGIVGGLAALLAALPTSIVPAKYQPWLAGGAAFLAVLAGALGYGNKPTPAPPPAPPAIQAPEEPNPPQK